MVPDTPVGALTSRFRLRVAGDVLRGQDLGEARGSANPLSQVGSGWVVGAHVVLGADGVVALHALHLSETEAQQAPVKTEPPTPASTPLPHMHTILKEVAEGGWEIKS